VSLPARQILEVGLFGRAEHLDPILEAARLAPELRIRLIGSGQLDKTMDERPENVEWVQWIEYEGLPAEYWGAGCALGIFGTSAKALRVIPNKAYQALACGAPLITADTPGARELLTDGESGPFDPTALASLVASVLARADMRGQHGFRAS